MKESKQASLRKDVAVFEKTDTRKSVRQLANTTVPLLLLWTAAYLSLSVSYALTLIFAIAAAGFVIRLFIIFHDCCHQSFFTSRRANDIVGTIAGVITLCPYEQWKNTHAIHHATSGNLEKRGIGDIWVMTVNEYAAASRIRRLTYRLYRNPFVLFGLGPIALFLIQYRFNRKGAKRKERMSTYVTNFALVALYALLMWTLGWEAFALVQAPVFLVSGSLGIWLFYVQHQFEESYFEHDDEWSYVKAAVEGSSFYKLPKPLQWITGNIGYHHVHHLNSRVPNYYLEEAHNATPPLHKATTITLRTSLESLRFHLWDEEAKMFVSFKAWRSRPARIDQAA